MMNLTVNGETTRTPDMRSVDQLLVHLGVKGRAVAVEVNQHLVPRREHADRPLHDGDVVEIVTLVGGG